LVVKFCSDLYENDPPQGGGKEDPLIPHPGEAIDIPSIDGEAVHCEPDEYADLVREMKREGVVRSHRRGYLCCAREVKVGNPNSCGFSETLKLPSP
jgi:hypothetical protein